MAIQTLLAFAAIWTVAMIGVGANSVVCMTAGAMNGFRRGLWSALGVTMASFIHAMIAVFGFSAVLLASAEAYAALKWAAVAYLVYLGLRQWRRAPAAIDGQSWGGETRRALFRRGLLISLTNPQAFLHYLVFFAPFIASNRPLVPQLMTLVPTAVGIVFVGYSVYVLLGSPLRHVLTSPRRQRALNRVAGSFYIVSAALLAVTDTRR